MKIFFIPQFPRNDLCSYCTLFLFKSQEGAERFCQKVVDKGGGICYNLYKLKRKYEFFEFVKIGLKISVGVILIFERISFTTANVPLLKKLFEDTQDEFGEKLVSGIFFIDCQFSTPLAIDKPIDVDVCFRNCVFKRDLIVANNINTNVIFNNCKFRNKFEFKDIQII